MSNTKTVMSQAANTLVKPLEVEDVFSTYLYDGNMPTVDGGDGSSQTIANGIDLAGEGGLVWRKDRAGATYAGHTLVDTERGVRQTMFSQSTSGQLDRASITSFNSDGFTIGDYLNGNQQGATYASWTFRKAPKFFDVVTYTGDGVAGRTVSHNLGSVPGCIIVKRLDLGSSWCVYHQGQNGGVNPEQYRILLNTADPEVDDVGSWNDTAPTDSVFSVGTTGNVNSSGGTYVAYLFAHNDGDGGFNGGDIIKCGSYTGNGSYPDGPEVDLGFEPQWLMLKRADGTGDWVMHDAMRVKSQSSGGENLRANTSAAEQTGYNNVNFTANGFKIITPDGQYNISGDTYIYIAIRRGTKVPESGTEVFAMDNLSPASTPGYVSNFVTDFALWRSTPEDYWKANSRLQGTRNLFPSDTWVEDAGASTYTWDWMDGFRDGYSGSLPDHWAWMWKRAPGFFDVSTYTGDNTSNRTVPHNLGVAPEMMWIKSRDTSGNWAVYHKDMGNAYRLILNTANKVVGPNFAYWSNTSPSASEFTLGDHSDVNSTGSAYISFLFSSSPSVSKVGSYTGNGSSQTIDCGFTTGARFVLLKRTNAASDWHVYDTSRGIVSGNDPYLMLSNAYAEVTSENSINPNNSGFVVVNDDGYNQIGDTWIFYAIA